MNTLIGVMWIYELYCSKRHFALQ